MNKECIDIKAKLIDYLEGELSQTERDKISCHIRECSDCPRELEEIRSLMVHIQQLPSREIDEEFWKSFQAGIKEGLMQSSSEDEDFIRVKTLELDRDRTDPHKWYNFSRLRRWIPYLGIAVAATLLLICVYIWKGPYIWEGKEVPANFTEREIESTTQGLMAMEAEVDFVITMEEDNEGIYFALSQLNDEEIDALYEDLQKTKEETL